MKKLATLAVAAAALTLVACSAETQPAQKVGSQVVLKAQVSCDAGQSGQGWFEWMVDTGAGTSWQNSNQTTPQSFNCNFARSYLYQKAVWPSSPGTYRYRICGLLTGQTFYQCADSTQIGGTNWDTFTYP